MAEPTFRELLLKFFETLEVGQFAYAAYGGVVPLHDVVVRMRKHYGSDDALVKALYDEFGAASGRSARKKGRAGYVSASAQQSDWYCTNRPQIKVNLNVPPEVTKGGGGGK